MMISFRTKRALWAILLTLGLLICVAASFALFWVLADTSSHVLRELLFPSTPTSSQTAAPGVLDQEPNLVGVGLTNRNTLPKIIKFGSGIE
jgi:hypothetical protein